MAKILIVRLGAMGDILHALPAATAIRAALPNSTVGWLVEERWSELLTAQGRKANPNTVSPQKPVVNTVHTLDTRRWRQHFFRPSATTEILGALKRVRKFDYDYALDFQGAIKSGLFAKMGGASVIAGYEDPRESGARFFLSQNASAPRRTCDRAEPCAGCAGAPSNSRWPRIETACSAASRRSRGGSMGRI